MKLSLLFVVVTAAFGGICLEQANASIQLEAVLSEATNSASPGRPGTIINTASLNASVADPLLTDFSSLGETPLSFTLRGQRRIQIALPDDQIASQLFRSLDIGYNSRSGSATNLGKFEDVSPLVSFENYRGDPLPAPSSSLVRLNNTSNGLVDARVRYSLPAGFSASFDSVTISTIVPAEFAGEQHSPLTSVRISGRIISDDPTESFGQFISFASPSDSAVPEPTSLLAWVGLSLCVGASRKVRRRTH